MSVNLRIKIGDLEFDYQGSETFLISELPDVIRTFTKMANQVEAPSFSPENNSQGSEDNFQLSENNIAAKLGVSNGSDMVIAASSHLRLVQNKPTFTRDEIRTTMQNATDYYKESYTKHLTSYLKSVVKDGKLIERSTDTYAIPGEEVESLKNRLAT